MNTAKIEELSTKINQAREQYYNGETDISDGEFDAWIDELTELDPKNAAVLSIGAEPNSEWKKHTHLFPLGSLNKVNSPEAMTKWLSDNAPNQKVFVTEKLDGLSIGCEYKDGKLTHAPLRGGGSGEGEDILTNVLKMKGCVSSIPGFTGVLRGEVILTKEDHQKYFTEYSNPRNAASGLCRRFDGEGAEHLTILFYQVLGQDFKTEEEQMDFLLGVRCLVPNYKVCSSALEVNDLWKEYQETIRDGLNYEIDGLVISIDDIKLQTSLGFSSSRPKGKMAMKFSNQMVKTTIKEISWQVGSMGRLCPVCWVEPVSILGSTVQKASIYNIAYIKKLGLDVGAEVEVCKAGEIIPRIERVIKGTGTTTPIPTSCPMCEETLVMDGEYLTCPNTEDCVSQINGRIRNWIKENRILEIGKTLIKKLVESGLVSSPADLYTLTVEQLAGLDRMGERSAEVAYNSLWSKNPIELDVFIGGLSIPLIGKSSIQLLMAEGFDSLKKIMEMTQEQMESIHGLGPARSESLYLGLKHNADVIQELLDSGVKIKTKEKKTMSDGKLAGKSFCLTGKMENKRADLILKLEAVGGEAHDKVRDGTTYLVIADPESTSAKAKAARKLGTTLISEEQLLEMV